MNKVTPTYLDEQNMILNPKLKVSYDSSDDTITTEDEKLTLPLLPTERKSLSKIRLTNPSKYFILKKDNNFFTVAEEISNNIDDVFMHENQHLCIDCSNFFNCPKVHDRDLNNTKKITKERYLSSKRIEKYSFITLGCEMRNRFLVWKCTKFINSSCDRENEEDNNDENDNLDELDKSDSKSSPQTKQKIFESFLRTISP